MFMVRFLRFLMGYVVLKAEGYFLERFLNLAAKERIVLWNLKRLPGGALQFCCGASDYKGLRTVASRTETMLQIVQKKGVSFGVRRYKKRRGFIAGIVIAVLVVWLMSSYIWSVSITGNIGVETSEIEKQLKEAGLYPGSFKPWIDVDMLQQDMLLRMPELSFIAVNIKGTKAHVEVKEGVPKPKIVPVNEPCNIKSSKDAQIISMEVYEGAAVVKPGDTVHQGQLLVSGIVDSKTMGARFVHASAKVLGRTWRNIDITEPLHEVKRTPTGNSITQNRLKIGSITINLYLNSGNLYENYDKINKIKDLKIFGVQLPFSISTTTYSEVKETKTPVSPEQAISKAEKRLADTIAKEELTATILRQDKLIESRGDSVVIRATLECSEDIAVTESIRVEN